MDQNRFEGAARETVGKVEEAVGDFTGDAETRIRGKIDQAAGKMQKNYGSAMQDVEDFATRLRERTREQPMTALLAAALIGYLVGRIGRWL
jgi:uncharacterized protein YjbJ (UPF0337 family)